MEKRIITAVLVGLLAACVMIVMLSCGDDECPTCPEPEDSEPDYHVLYCCEERPPQVIAYTYSLKYGTTVDSAFYDQSGRFWDATFSNDGSFTYYTRTAVRSMEPDSWTWVTDTRTGDTLAICAGHGGHKIDISTDGNYLLTSEGRMLTLFRLPDLDILYEDTSSAGIGNAVFHPTEKKFYFHKQPGAYYIFVGTFDDDSVTSVTPHQTFNRAGEAVGPAYMSVSPDGEILAVDMYSQYGARYFHAFDTDSLAIVHETKVPAWRLHRDHSWSADGKRVFLAFRGGFDAPDIGGVDVYDITTNGLQYYITADDISLGQESFQPLYISISPDDEKVVILNGVSSLPVGSILVFDVSTKLLSRRFDTYKQGYESYTMALIPIDWEKEKRR
ncbi:MAG: hypothetical protein ACTSPR_07065 [Candidatus Thorarchaeota archaeon]